MRQISGYVFIAFVVGLLIYDLWVFLAFEDATVSMWFWELNDRMGWLGYVTCFVLGILTAHLFPVLRAQKVTVIKE
jgi:hypothetical protein